MKKLVSYFSVDDIDLESLAQSISNFVKDGFEPIGDITKQQYKDTSIYVYTQALGKFVEVNE